MSFIFDKFNSSSFCQLDSLSDYEKKRYSNLIQNWEVLESIGITPKLPDFVQKKNTPSKSATKGLLKNDLNISKTKFKLFALPQEKKGKTVSTKRKQLKNGSLENERNKEQNKMGDNEKITFSKEILKIMANNILRRAEIQLSKLGKAVPEENAFDIEINIEENNESNKRRYPKRNIKRKSYQEEEISSDDEYLYCDDCECEYKGACLIHGPMLWVCDRKVSKNTTERASKTIPYFLSIGNSSIKKAGLGIWTEFPLRKGMVFGPYEGIITRNKKEAQKSGYAWMVCKRGKADHFIEAVKKDSSSWMRFVNCADVEEKQNLVAFQYKKNIYYKTYKPVLPFQELLVWYGGDFAVDLGINIYQKAELVETRSVDGFRCDVCPALFSSRDVMERHMNQHRHENHDSRYRCPHCLYSTNKKGSLQRHLPIHSGEKNYACSFCSKKFNRESNLLRHERIHTGERPFSCSTCGRAFNVSSNLRDHERIHSGLRPHRCSSCGKDFTRLSHLRHHERVHTRQRPYTCPHCQHRCSRSSNMNEHIIVRHTKQYPHPCTHCSRGFLRPCQLRQHLEKRHS